MKEEESTRDQPFRRPQRPHRLPPLRPSTVKVTTLITVTIMVVVGGVHPDLITTTTTTRRSIRGKVGATRWR